MRGAWVHLNPYDGLAESVITSNVVDLRDAFDFTVSYHTTAGSSATWQWQNSNHSVIDSIPEASWSVFTVQRPSATTLLQPPLGARFARSLRSVSDASWVLNANKQVR